MNKRLVFSYRMAIFLVIMIPCLCVSWEIIRWCPTDVVFVIVDAVWVLILAVFVLMQTRSFSASEDSKIIILIGFFLRVILVLWGSYGTDAIAIFLSGRGNDQEAFLQTAQQYFEGKFSEFVTYYPYIINAVFHFTGPNRVMVQLFNVLCWFLGLKLIIAIAKESYGKKIQFILICYVFCPYPMIMSTQLLRESIIGFLSMLSLYCLWKWMNSRQIKNIIAALGASIIPIVLHSGNIVLIAGIFLVFIQWNYRLKRWRGLNWRMLVLILGIIMAIPLYENIFAQYLPYLPQKLSLEMITGNIEFVPARADYMPNVVVNNWQQFLLWSIYRMIYFWLSPTPRFWSSPSDIIGFLLDSIPMFLLWIQIFRSIRRNRQHSQSLAGIYILFLYTFIYAWGTRNAGTAMRHRGQLLGIMIMTILMGMNTIHQVKETA